jgi:hypothetical protein
MGETMTEYYIETHAYHAVVNIIAAMTHLNPEEIKIALGEHGNIWPQCVRPTAPD